MKVSMFFGGFRLVYLTLAVPKVVEEGPRWGQALYLIPGGDKLKPQQFIKMGGRLFSRTLQLKKGYRYLRIETMPGYGAHFHLQGISGPPIYKRYKTIEEALNALPHSLRNDPKIIEILRKAIGG
jgi:hypothetical protein